MKPNCGKVSYESETPWDYYASGFILEKSTDGTYVFARDRNYGTRCEVTRGMVVEYENSTDKTLIKSILRTGGSLGSLADDSPLRGDEGIVRFAIDHKSHEELGYASHALRDNIEVVKLAIGKHADALQFASEALRDDRELVMFAFHRSQHHQGFRARYASARLKNDPAISGTLDKAMHDYEYAFDHQ